MQYQFYECYSHIRICLYDSSETGTADMFSEIKLFEITSLTLDNVDSGLSSSFNYFLRESVHF